MTRNSKITAAVLATLAVGLFSTTAFADRGHGMAGDDMENHMANDMGGAMGGRMGGDGVGPMAAFDFAAIDTNKDGKLTPQEMDAWRAAQAAALDADGDGLISADELTQKHMQAMQARAADMATRMIERRDTDGDGKLSAVEMATPPMPERLFERMDTDNDGALSEAEIDAAKERMTEMRGNRRGGHGRHGGHNDN